MFWRNLTIWYLIFTPIAGGLSVLGNIEIAGKNISGYLWMGLLLCALYLLAIGGLRRLDHHALALWCPWILWCGFLWLSLIWCSPVDQFNVQNALQMSMPLVVGLLATAAIRSDDDLRRVLKGFGFAGALLAMFAVGFILTPHSSSDLEAGPRDAALLAVLLGGLAFASFGRRKAPALLGWGACLAFTMLSGSRIASVALLAMPVLHFGYRSLRWNLFGLIAFAGLGIALFYTPLVQERFFYSGHGELTDLFSGDVNGAGRFDAWPAVWDQAWQRPLLGAGVGTVSKFVPTVWEGMAHVHNDYLRIGFEFGLVGLAGFVLAAAWQLAALYRGARNSAGLARVVSAGAWLGFCALLITCATDNTLIYNLFYTDPLFLLIGSAYGVGLAEQRTMAGAPVPHLRYRGGLAT
jgi:O-antigen ligase